MAKPPAQPKTAGARRTAKGTFAKGTSGNPGGRPKGLADAIRAKSKDGNGDELLDIAFAGIRGEPLGADLEKLRDAGIDIAQGLEKSLGILPAAERVRLLTYLLDQLHGKARQGIELTGKDGGAVKVAALGKFTDDELDVLDLAADVFARAAALEAGDSPGEGA